jgi:putative hemolysin
MTQAALAASALPAGAKHVVDALIEERAPLLSKTPWWPLVRPPLYLLLMYGKARGMADAIGPMRGRAALEHLSRLLQLRPVSNGLDRLPRNGRCVIIANHPTGIADGIALYDAVKAVRPDICFFANADAHRVCPGFTDVLIPVEWELHKRSIEKTKVTLRLAQQAFAEERAIMIFPAGRLARRIDGLIQDPSWEPSAVTLARKHKAPIVPIHLAGPYPFLFHFFNRFSKELRDMTLFHELLNKTRGRFDLTFGPVIAPDVLAGEADQVTLALKHYVERVLPVTAETAFQA